MEESIQDFIEYMKEEKKVSYNTQISYERDLKKAIQYFVESGIQYLEEVTLTDLTAYMFYMERKGFSTASISRSVASLKKFFQYMNKRNILKVDPAEGLKAPKVEKKVPNTLSVDEVEFLLQQPEVHSPKGIRDRAMLELLYATGIRASEMIGLKCSNLNLELGYILCEGEKSNRAIPFGKQVGEVLSLYLEQGRSQLLKEENDILFLNRNGNGLTRQGFWKIIKGYAKKAGIEKEITPHMIRHSFALHLLQNGSNIQRVKERLGHAELSVTESYIKTLGKE